MKKNSFHLIAVIRAKRKADYRYRIVNINDPNSRIVKNGSIKYIYEDKDPIWCRNNRIGGLYYRNEADRRYSFRYNKRIPIIDGDALYNVSTIMQCSERIVVNHEGERLLKRDYPNEYTIIDVRREGQKKSYQRTLSLRNKVLNGKMDNSVARDLVFIKDSMDDTEYKKYLTRVYRNKSRNK